MSANDVQFSTAALLDMIYRALFKQEQKALTTITLPCNNVQQQQPGRPTKVICAAECAAYYYGLSQISNQQQLRPTTRS